MTDDIRKQSDTLRDSDNLNPTERGVSDIRAQSDTLRSADAAANSGESRSVRDAMGDSNGSSMLNNIKDSINRSIGNVTSADTVPMTGLDDTSVDKVLDASPIGGGHTLTEAAGGSGKQAAFGVMDALSGRGANVQPGVPLSEQQNNQ